MASTATVAPAQEAGRPQPQTTIEAPGGPFIRHSQPGRAPLYSLTGQAFGGIVTQPLVARPGYFRNIRVEVQGTGGSGTTTVTAAADAPYNIFSLVQFKDAFGTPLIVAPGYETLKLIPLFSGGYGLFSAADIANMPSYSGIVTGANASGNFKLAFALPLEFAKGYGVLSAANASLLPTLQFNLNASSVFYGVAPTTPPTMNVTVDTDFYWLPDGVTVEPPGIGTTRQWVLQQANPTIASGASARVQLPRLGGYLDTIILIMRDSTGARIDGWPSRLQLYIDGVPLIDSLLDEIYDDMYNVFGGITRPTGVLAFSRKTSLSQVSLGLLDTGETFLSTNPGTLIEVNGAPWGTITNAPATINVLVGQVVPTGALIQGLPEI